MDDGNNYVSEDEMDEDEEVGDEVDMEFGEEDSNGSDNTSTDSDGDDQHGNELGIEAHGSEEGWQAEDDDDDAMNDDDDDDDDDDVDLNGEGVEQDITWQVKCPTPASFIRIPSYRHLLGRSWFWT